MLDAPRVCLSTLRVFADFGLLYAINISTESWDWGEFEHMFGIGFAPRNTFLWRHEKRLHKNLSKFPLFMIWTKMPFFQSSDVFWKNTPSSYLPRMRTAFVQNIWVSNHFSIHRRAHVWDGIDVWECSLVFPSESPKILEHGQSHSLSEKRWFQAFQWYA